MFEERGEGKLSIMLSDSYCVNVNPSDYAGKRDRGRLIEKSAFIFHRISIKCQLSTLLVCEVTPCILNSYL